MVSFIKKFIGQPANYGVVYVVRCAKTGHYRVDTESVDCDYSNDLVYATKSRDSVLLADEIRDELSIYKVPNTTEEFKCTEHELLAAITYVIKAKDHDYYRKKIREMKAFIESDECKAFMTGKSTHNIKHVLHEFLNDGKIQFDVPCVKFIRTDSFNEQFRAAIIGKKLSPPTNAEIGELLKTHAGIAQHFYIDSGVAIPGYIITL